MNESQIRFQARMEWREEGSLEGYKKYPLDSLERMIYIDEAQKIKFNDQFNSGE